MAKLEHTAGDWEFDSFDRGYILGPKRKVKNGKAEMPVYLAELTDADSEGLFIRSHAERKANGRLMAAAPRLLDALIHAGLDAQHGYITPATAEKINSALALTGH